MSALTEREIIACLKENLRIAAERCEHLAAGRRGPVYVEFRAALKLAEGACRQMLHWREDTRWGPFALKLEEAHQRCGGWLRAKEPAWRFAGLAEVLRGAYREAHDLETRRTGRTGAILPLLKPAPPSERKFGQIILPPGYQTH